jgi:D-alanine-D-alanine ligase
MKQNRVTLLYSQVKNNKENYNSDVESVYNALCCLGYKTQKIPVGNNIGDLISDIKENNPDFIFNLCEEACGNSWGEIYIAGVLELLRVPYTGSSPFSLSLSLDKAKTKDVLLSNGINVPRYMVYDMIRSSAQAQLRSSGPRELKFPIIVKPLQEDGSYGIWPDSVVYNKKNLLKKVFLINKQFNQPAIAEEYKEGRELNVSILGNGKNLKVLPISEVDYSKMPEKLPKICTYKAKWDENSDEYKGTIPVCPADLSKKTRNMAENAAVKAYNAMLCRDYARIDIRLDKNKIPYIIDVNPNPCLAPDSGFVRSGAAAGYNYEGLIGEILENCRKRWKK